MCLLICLRGRDGSLILAANRDERYDRPGKEPFLWQSRPRILAGRDELAGGTWLAVNERGVVAAVTNRQTADGEDASRPSRGNLPLLACRCSSAAEAGTALRQHFSATRYNGFNLFVSDVDDAFVVQSPGGVDVQQVRADIHVVGNGGWNDISDPRVARAREMLGQRKIEADFAQAEDAVAHLEAICRDHQGSPGPRTLCMHGESAGTVSSTILLLDAGRRLRRYLYASGPPCRHAYHELASALCPL